MKLFHAKPDVIHTIRLHLRQIFSASNFITTVNFDRIMDTSQYVAILPDSALDLVHLKEDYTNA